MKALPRTSGRQRIYMMTDTSINCNRALAEVSDWEKDANGGGGGYSD